MTEPIEKCLECILERKWTKKDLVEALRNAIAVIEENGAQEIAFEYRCIPIEVTKPGDKCRNYIPGGLVLFASWSPEDKKYEKIG